jgi:DNA-binding response OmpR family regulator
VRRTAPLLVSHWQGALDAVAQSAVMPPATDGSLALLEEPEALPRPQHVAARNAVLIVEDDPRMAGLLREGLALEGEQEWEVHVAADGMQALELAATTPPDVVLLDVLLPGLDGAEVYRRLRANKRTRAARILFLSAGTSYDLWRQGIEDGVLLRKPFDVGEVAPLVRALLAG